MDAARPRSSETQSASSFFARPGAVVPVRLLALGDSYTVGTAVDAGDRWVTRLVERLRTDGLEVADPRVVAADGWPSDRLAAAVERRSLEPPYDLVTLLVGANDAYRGRPVEDFRPKFVALLERAVELAGGDPASVVVVTIPDYSVTPHVEARARADHAERLEAYNRVVEREAAAAGARLADVVPVSRAAADDADLLADDDLHPSAEQYERWLDRIYPVARSALEP